RADEEELAEVDLRPGPEELPAPGLLDPLRLEGERVETAQIRRRQLPLVHASDPTTALVRVQARRPVGSDSRRAGRKPLRIGCDLLLRAAQVLRRVHGQPEALVAEGAELAFLDELGKRRRLM